MATTQSTGSEPAFNERDARALTECMTVLEDVGLARDAANLYLVVSESGSEYVVDAQDNACECADTRYRDNRCKHSRRVAFATGQRPIPSWVDVDAIDPLLGRHTTGDPLVARPRGYTVSLEEAREQIDSGAER